LVEICGEGYNDSVFIDFELNLLIAGYDFRIIFMDIKDPDNITLISTGVY
jgi:hypothetical protein